MSSDVLYQDPVMQLVASGDVFVERWSGKGDVPRLQTLVDVHGAFVRRLAPAKTLHLVHLTTGELALFDADIRRLIAEHTEVIDAHLAASAIVYPDTGFGAAAMRTGISLATMLRRSRYPFKVFSDVEAALDWLPNQRERPAKQLADGRAMRSWYLPVDATLGAT